MSQDADRWERIQKLFHRALDLPESERRRWMEEECGDDPSLADEVMALLEEDARTASPLDRDLPRLAHEVFDGSVPMLRSMGPYRLVRVLGRGGMGVVYLAEREDLGSRVAIKVLRDAALSPARRERFRQEARTLARLNHPAIASLHDADVLPDGTPYFVMEYVEGRPLTDHCAIHRPPLRERLRLFRTVCEAVQHAHRHAVVHRDLKPSNILVGEAEAEAGPRVRLLDFGIAKHLDDLDAPENQTLTELRLMTPSYAAPEQLGGQPVGTYTDVYALGVILYELLTGRHPYRSAGLSPEEVEKVVLEGKPEKPSSAVRRALATGVLPRDFGSLGAAAWADLDVLCLTAMHPDPQRRYGTAEALLRDLAHFRDGRPLEARPDTVGYRSRKFLRRHRRPVATAALAATAFVGLVGLHTVRLAEARDQARASAEKAEQISEYLISLFESGDPYTADGESQDVRLLLDEGERRAEELSEQPVLKAAMLDVLGRVRTQRSDYERAESLLRRALEIRREAGEPIGVAESLSSLAGLLVDQGDFDEAEGALREALALRERHLPSNHPHLARTMSDLGSVLNQKGHYRDAEMLHQEAVRIHRSMHDRPHENLNNSLNRLAVSLFQQGRYDEAEPHYREALEVSRALFGPEDVRVTRVLANLGKLHEELGDYLLADSLLTEALRIRRAALGDDHFETAVGLGQLATVAGHLGQHDRAERYLREALAIRERILVPGHPNIGTTLNNLASILERRGEYDEAGTLYRRAADIYREGLGERHRFTAIALANLAQVLYLTGELAEAHDHYLEAVSILEEVHQGGHQEVAHNRSRLGGILVAMERYDEAEPILREAYLALDERLGSQHPRTREAATRLVELYEEWAQPERAAPYRELLAAAEHGDR